MSLRLGKPLVHGAWQASWWAGDPSWARLLGPPPSLTALQRAADALRPTATWHGALHPTGRRPAPPQDALVVLAGQQPVLGGGPALVAHKAATAIALARQLSEHWRRPVVPVFLLATQDHDTSEVDHIDTIDISNECLHRIRCPIDPQNEMFCRARWGSRGFSRFKREINKLSDIDEVCLTSLSSGESLADHVAWLLGEAFGSQGLVLVEAHRLPGNPTQAILSRALQEPGTLAQILEAGRQALLALGQRPAFDPTDPRPLVLESRERRRRRLSADDHQALARLACKPDDFSPHAALRPLVQAATLPVVAQVCGPSEILYLGQARGLHQLFGLSAPVLVPRLEATQLPPRVTPLAAGSASAAADERRGTLLARLDLSLGRAPGQRAERTLVEAARSFTSALTEQDPGLAPRLLRFEDRLIRGARRLAEAPLWRGRHQLGSAQAIHPRGRYQDTTLAWLPRAWARGDPASWAAHIVSLARPLEPPEHVAHTDPEPSPDG